MMKKLFIFVIWTLLSSIAILILLELTVRMFNYNSQGTKQVQNLDAYKKLALKEQYFNDYSKYNSKSIGRKQYTPYSLWKEDPFTSKTFNVTANGRRKTLNQEKSLGADRNIKIGLFGGSTLFSAQVPDSDTIPSLLAKKLNDKYENLQFTLVNYGTDGFLSSQERVLLTEELLKDQKFDVVILYDGANDIFHRAIANISHSFFRRFEGALDRKIALKELFAAILHRSQLLKLLGGNIQIQYPADLGAIKKRVEEALTLYTKNIKFISDTLAQDYNFTPLFIWQPNLITTKKTLSADEDILLANIDKSLIYAFRTTSNTIKKQINDFPSTFSDCSSCFDNIENGIFIDFCHVTTEANEAIASHMLTMIEQNHFKK